MKKNTFLKGITDGLPICFGYLSVGFAFGIFAVENGASRIDEIIEKSGFSAPKVLSNITILEIRGIIIRDLSGNIKLKKHF